MLSCPTSAIGCPKDTQTSLWLKTCVPNWWYNAFLWIDNILIILHWFLSFPLFNLVSVQLKALVTGLGVSQHHVVSTSADGAVKFWDKQGFKQVTIANNTFPNFILSLKKSGFVSLFYFYSVKKILLTGTLNTNLCIDDSDDDASSDFDDDDDDDDDDDGGDDAENDDGVNDDNSYDNDGDDICIIIGGGGPT